MSAYPDPQDPRVQEDIREAVQRARESALNSSMSEQDITNMAAGYLGVAAASAPGIELDIQREVRRQSGTDWPVQDQRSRYEGPPPITPAEPSPGVSAPDPVFGVRVDHWCTDEEIQGIQGYATYDNTMMQSRYDPTCPSEFYDGYLTALVGLMQSVAPHDTLDRYRSVVETIDGTFKTWPGTRDRSTGAALALTNAWEYANSGSSVIQILAHLHGEIACVADCFQIARADGL
ncbi:hypothetical protein [Nocardia sp. NBC_01009]|uniref:hypothetical protein n=1 Tax=Nocardia sp. NBC_01009 TaxID=2975996 RepID=UPI00386DB79B|nr:hypothetical protein OHA42_38220 [Nocardia sp. NBC_01009]